MKSALPRLGPVPLGPERGPACPLVSLEEVSRTFLGARGTEPVLERLSLTIGQGELLCIVGPSGCGKSSLLNLIAGLDAPDQGRVTVRGRAASGPGPDRALMFQEHALFPWRTVAGNVAFPLEQLGWSACAIRRRVDELLHAVHLEHRGASRIHELSGGMRQRVALARALACQPDVLLMDEPFASLDAQTRDVLLEELERVWRALGTTVVFVTHDLREAIRLGTRIAVMASRPGRIVELYEVTLRRPRSPDAPEVNALAAQLKRALECSRGEERSP